MRATASAATNLALGDSGQGGMIEVTMTQIGEGKEVDSTRSAERGGNAAQTHALPPGADARILAYRHHVERFEMPEAEKLELLHALWQIMRSFVDRAFGDDPVQLVCKIGDGPSAIPAVKSALSDVADAEAVIDLEPEQTPHQEQDLADTFTDHVNGYGERKR